MFEDPQQSGKWIVQGDLDGDGNAAFQIDILPTAGRDAIARQTSFSNIFWFKEPAGLEPATSASLPGV